MGLQSSIAVEGACEELLKFEEDLRTTDATDSERLALLLAKILSIKSTAAAGWY